jgi:YegS/Rv2252/BmrU family lipid kinase
LRRGGLSFEFQCTEGAGHAGQIAYSAAADGYQIIIAVGGDGTINEVANGILTSDRAAMVTLGIIGTGTGNDLIRSLGVPPDYLRACRRLLAGYQGGGFKGGLSLIDVGLASYTVGTAPHTRYFVNGAGVGFDAEVVEAAKRMPRQLGHKTPFVMGLLRTLPTYRNKRVQMAVAGVTGERSVLSVVVANGAYFGGGMKIAPEAIIDDGKLDIITIGDVGKLELLRVFPRVYKGTHITHPKVRAVRAEEVTIASSERLLFQADGEILGEGPVSIRIIPQALRLMLGFA